MLIRLISADVTYASCRAVSQGAEGFALFSGFGLLTCCSIRFWF